MTTTADRPARVPANALEEALTIAVEEALEQMFFTAVWPAPSASMPNDGLACSTIEFAGQQRGLLTVAAPPDTVDCLLASLRGEERAKTTASEQAMLLGELANMLCGQMVSRCDPERPLYLGLPVPLPASMSRPADITLSLETDAGPLWVLLWLTEDATTAM